MKIGKNKKIIYTILAILLAGIIVFAIFYMMTDGKPYFYIDMQVSEYVETGKWNGKDISSFFSEDSAESLFLTGMNYYAENDTVQAEKYFKQAEKKSYTDATLPAYLNIYLNQCFIARKGIGNEEYVKKALDAMAECPAFINKPYWVWHLSYSLIEDRKSGFLSLKLFDEYMEKAKGLTDDEVLLLNTYKAVMKNITGEYSESILLFHNYLNKALDMPESYNVIKTKNICTNYIADMYYSYEDYERASALYMSLIEQEMDDPYENAQLKYTAYINMATIYLEKKEYPQAKQMVKETQAILPYLSENFSEEVDAFLYNILANIELERSNIEGASVYFEKCKSFMQNNESSAFFDTTVYFGLTHCKILEKTGEKKQAEKILLKLLNDNIVESKMEYQVRKTLADVYLATGQKDKYYKEQDFLLREQNKRIQQYQSDYCEVINYYDQLLDLKKEHDISVQRNEILAIVLLIVLILLGFIIKISILKYKESMIDSLSGLYNRKKLDQEFVSYDKTKHNLISYGIIMADIDFFKKYNDTYGHVAGDMVIRQVSDIIKQSVRENDIVIRYGGEEILILLKNINHSTVESIAERIRINVENMKIAHNMSECNDYVTLSLGGFYISNPILANLPDSIKEADNALYHSKQNGRNMVTVF